MKKAFYTLALSLLLVTCVFAMGCDCAGGRRMDTSNIIGVWEVDNDGGASYITRIEFKKSSDPNFEDQGEYSYYIDGGTTAYLGTYSKRADGSYNLIPASFSESPSGEQHPYIATLAGGKLILQPSSETSIYYHKVSD